MTSVYKYETHSHTSETSLCGTSSGAEYVKHYKKLGYSGIFITDHFVNGNARDAADRSWQERMEAFFAGYDAAAAAGRDIGLDVFFGWEYGEGWAHFLTYGLGKEWLLAHPDMLEWKLLDYFDRAHEGGGFIVHAHPFRDNIEEVKLTPRKIDAVEVINASQSAQANGHAKAFALDFHLPQTAGSDIHNVGMKRLCGVIAPRRLAGGLDYADAFRAGELKLFDEAQPAALS